MPAYRLIGRICLLLLCLLAGSAAAQQGDSFQYETGTVLLPRANARIEIPPGWKFLSMERLAGAFEIGAERIRDVDELGYLLPATADITADNAWWVTVSSFGDGYIAMDSERVEPYGLTWRSRDVYKWISRSSGARFEFVNYGRAPIVDSGRSSCRWTERIRYPDDGGSELLDIYGLALNRRGAVMVSVEYMPDQWQDAVEGAVDHVLQSIRFNVGERYEDHNPADPVADFEMSHVITGEYWLGPQTWSAWLQEPVRLKLGSGWKKVKLDIPNWAFWGLVILTVIGAIAMWMRGGGGNKRHVGKVKGARR